MNYYNVQLWLGLGQIVNIEVEQKRVLKINSRCFIYTHMACCERSGHDKL